MIKTETFPIDTTGNCQVIDITDRIVESATHSPVTDGILTIFATGTTVSVAIIEYEPGLVSDLQTAMERLVPRGIPYQHNTLNNDDNGHAHTQATLVGQSLVVPLVQNKAILGTWQRIVIVDFDSRPRSREVTLQIMGE